LIYLIWEKGKGSVIAALLREEEEEEGREGVLAYCDYHP